MSGISQADAFDMLARGLDIAREKHPVFARSDQDAVHVIWQEWNELFNAVVNGEGEARIVAECIDVAVTAMRRAMGEVEG